MASPFRPVDRATPYLMPPSLEEWLPEDHMARFVVEIVDRLDTTALEQAYAGRGSKAYHPKMLLSLLFYGYATGVCSSRKLEAATYESVPVRYVAANQHPDHDTICTFRRRFLPELQELFVEILLIAAELDLTELGTVSLDGTKVRANASKHKAMSWKRALELEEKLEEEVALLMQKAEEADQREDLDHVDLPEEIRLREKRLQGIREAKRRIKERARERYEAEEAAYEERMAKRQEEEERTGRKKPGRKPEPPEPGPRPKDQVNFTDPESRIMPGRGGQFEQCYNAQQLVDTESRLVVAAHVTQAPVDKQELVVALEQLAQLPETLGQADCVLADAGYFSNDNVVEAAERGLQPLIAEKRSGKKLTLEERLAPEPSAEELSSEELTPLERMRLVRQSRAGRRRYALRKSTSEPVIGIIKEAMGFRQFLLRGLEKVTGEWTLVSIAYNLRRLHRLWLEKVAEAADKARGIDTPGEGQPVRVRATP